MKNLKTNLIAMVTCLMVLVSISSIGLAETVNYGEELNNIPTQTSTVTFKDVTETHWANKYISDMVNKKIVSGYPDGKFRPDRVISRVEFAKIIIAASGLVAKKTKVSSFSDIKTTDWYSPFVETAKNYLTGYKLSNGKYVYKPNALALREDICVAIVKIKGYDAKLADRSMIEAMFKDYDSISDSAKDYVAIAVENKLVSGFPDETFRSQNSLTRAEACTILWRAFMYGDETKVTDMSEEAPEVVVDTKTPEVVKEEVKEVEEPVKEEPKEEEKPIVKEEPKVEEEKPVVVDETKFNDKVLFGGSFGHDDGNKSSATIGKVISMVTTKSGDVYFIDADKNYGAGSIDTSTNRLRKYDSVTGSVYTIAKENDLTYISNGEKVKFNNYRMCKLVYDPSTDKVYMSGFEFGNVVVVYQVRPELKAVVNDKYAGFTPNDFAVVEDGNIIYSNYTTGFKVFRVRENGKATEYIEKQGTRAKGYENYLEAIVTSNTLTVMKSGTSSSISKYDMRTNEWKDVNNFDKYDSITAFNGKFYASNARNVDVIDTEGKIAPYLTSTETNLLGVLGSGKMSIMNVIAESNIIYYDSVSGSVRQITKK